MSKGVNALLSKSIEEYTEAELVKLRDGSTYELKRRVFEDLELVAEQYVELYGRREGIEQLGEDLCKRIAPGKHPGGWAGLVRYLIKISG